MPEPEPWLLFVKRFNQLGAPYMVSGSVAATLYGEPRFTNDIDLVVFLSRDHISRLVSLFSSEVFYCPPVEVIRIESSRERRGHVNLIHIPSGYKADLYLSKEDPLHIWGMSRARVVRVDEEPVHLAPVEYVIVRKLEFYREGGSEKHVRDIRGMLSLSSASIDFPSLLRWIEEYGLREFWNRVSEAF
jgi:hypothetical protein